MLQNRRRASLTDILTSSSEEEKPPEGTSKQRNSAARKNKNSLRRCKSNPEKIQRKNLQEVNPNDWQSSLDKERGYVTDLIADQQPTTVQPQLSYFAYLGKNCPAKGRYQSVSMTDNTQTVINLGNAIYFQNRPKSSPRLTNTFPEVMTLPRNTVIEPIKTDNTQLLECCTCMCCAKAFFYHCTKDRELERNWADEPCTCERPGIECVTRWGILGVLSLFIPCLLCYPVANGCCKPCSYMSRKWEP